MAGSTSANTGVAPQCQTAFAVAMNDSDGTITSSPGPTPEAYSARCSAVVQFVVAIAWRAPTRAANACSKACTRGPCETQPDSITAASASASPPKNFGFANGTFITRSSPASARPARSGRRRGARPTTRRAGSGPPRARPRPRSRAASRAALVSASRRGTLLTPRSGPCATARSEPMTRSSIDASPSRLVSVPLATLNTASVASLRAASRFARAMSVVKTKSIVCVAVAEDQRRLAGGDALHPAHEHLGVDAVDVHPRAVDVEVAQRDVVEALHRVEASAAGPR